MVSFGQGGAIWDPKRTRIPDFDRPPIAGGDDSSPIVVVGDRRDFAVMGAGFLALELECGCVGKQEASDLAEERRFGPNSHLRPMLIVPE